MSSAAQRPRKGLPLGKVVIGYCKGYTMTDIAYLISLASRIEHDPYYVHNVYTRGENAGKKVPHLPRPRVSLASFITPADNYLKYETECIARYQRLVLGDVGFTLKPRPQKDGERFVTPEIVPKTIYPQHPWRGIPIADLCVIMQLVLETEGYTRSYKQIVDTLCASMEGTGKTYNYKQVHRACKLLRIQFKASQSMRVLQGSLRVFSRN